ncbi:MAG: Arm DNA-binding domain-containing protein [Erythrobacter sp.]
MALTNITIQNAKAKEKPYKLFDGLGLYVLVRPKGSKYWYLKYRFGGSDRTLSLGHYPSVSLKEARELRRIAREQLECGVDPNREKKKQRVAAKFGLANTFKLVGDEYLERMALEGRAAVTIRKSRWLLSLLERDIPRRRH